MGSKRPTATIDELVMCDHCGEPIPTFWADERETKRLIKQGDWKKACEDRTNLKYELRYGIWSQRVYFRLHEQCFNAFEPSLKERHQILLAGAKAEYQANKTK